MTADWVEIDRVPVGIPGLDLITYGGLTRDRLTLVSGTAGSGKTVFANQFLAVGIRDADEPGVFVTFEERPEAIRRNVRSFGWDVGAWEEAAKWRFVDASPRHEVETVFTGGSYDLQPLLARVLGAVDEIGARRAALDSVGALIAQFEASAPARHIIFRLADRLAGTGCHDGDDRRALRGLRPGGGPRLRRVRGRQRRDSPQRPGGREAPADG